MHCSVSVFYLMNPLAECFLQAAACSPQMLVYYHPLETSDQG